MNAYLLIESDAGVSVVAQPFEAFDDKAEQAALIEEMDQNEDLASETGTARAWRLIIDDNGQADIDIFGFDLDELRKTRYAACAWRDGRAVFLVPRDESSPTQRPR